MRADNRAFELVMLPEYMLSIRRHAKCLKLTLNDFNYLLVIMRMSKHQAAEQPLAADDPSLRDYMQCSRGSVLKAVKRLLDRGLIIREDHIKKGKGMIHTYQLTRAGRNAIETYYDQEYV
jgi:DNA-binding MarR family transcriptional regulator